MIQLLNTPTELPVCNVRPRLELPDPTASVAMLRDTPSTDIDFLASSKDSYMNIVTHYVHSSLF